MARVDEHERDAAERLRKEERRLLERLHEEAAQLEKLPERQR